MLQELLKDLQTSLKSYNQGLAKQNVLVDIPWTMVDGELNIQRLIFRKDKSLYIVKDGEIQESKWEYLTAMNSLIIEVGGKKILLNEVFADGKALILKKDGKSMNFLAFANQNEISSLDLVDYFRNLVDDPLESNKPNISEVEETEMSNINYLGIYIITVIIIMIFVSLFY